MSKVDQKFIDFLQSRVPGKANQSWLDDAVEEYETSLACPLCGGEVVNVIVAPKTFVRCSTCHTRNEIDIDKLRPMDYNIVTFLYEDKIREILTSKQETA